MNKYEIIKPWLTPFYVGNLVLLTLVIILSLLLFVCRIEVFQPILIVLFCLSVKGFVVCLIIMIVFLSRKYVITHSVVYEYTFGVCTRSEPIASSILRVRGNRIWKSILLKRQYHWFERGRPDDFSIDCIASQDVNRIYQMLSDLKEKSLQVNNLGASCMSVGRKKPF